MGTWSAATILVLCAFALPLNSQVRIDIPARQYAAKERITAKVLNSTNRTIAYCAGIETFGWSATGKIEPDLTISPFEVWHKSEEGKWGILADGVDAGTSWRIESLEPGQSEEYSFKVRAKGENRLLLEYEFGNGEDTECSDPYRRVKKVRSRTFTVR